MARRLRIPFRFIPIPTVIFEEWINKISYSELKCYAFISRQTYGLSKPRHLIYISQFVQFTGLSRATVKRALAGLLNKHLIRVTGSPRKPRQYEILMPHDIQIERLSIVSH